MHFAVTQTHVNGERIAAILPCIGGTFVPGEEPTCDYVQDEVIVTVDNTDPLKPVLKLYRAGNDGVIEFNYDEPWIKRNTILQALRTATAAQGWG